MGCASSLASSNTLQPTITNSNRISSVMAAKQFHDSSTQTDQIQVVDVWVNTLTNSNLMEDRPNASSCAQSQTVPDNNSSLERETCSTLVSLMAPLQHPSVLSNPRLTASSDSEDIRWVLYGMDAQRFQMVIQQDLQCIGPTVIQDALDAMKKADDLADLPETIWNLLETADKEDDATYFIRAYTADSAFYRILNRTLAKYELEDLSEMDEEEQLAVFMRGALGNVNELVNRVQAFQAGQQVTIQNSESNWAKLYLRPLWKILMTPNAAIRFQGRTYRGFWLSEDELSRYDEDNVYVSNKAITSTSKSRSVAQSFIDHERQSSAGMFSAIFTYVIESDIALYALDVGAFSELSEEEVLLLPGIPLIVTKVQFISPNSVEIELSSAFQSMMASIMPALSSSSCSPQ